MLKNFFAGMMMLMTFSSEKVEVIGLGNIDQIEIVGDVYDVPSNQMQQEIVDLAFNVDSNIIGFVNASNQWQDGNVYFFNTATFEQINLFKDTVLRGTSLHFAENNLFIGDQSGDVSQYNLNSGRLISTASVGVGGDIEVITTSVEDEYIAVTSTTEFMGEYLFYLGKLGEEPIFQVPAEGRGYSAVFHPSDHLVAFSTLQEYSENFGERPENNPNWFSSVQILDVTTGQLVALCNNHRNNLTYAKVLAFTPNGQNIIYAADDGIRIWDLRDCRQFDDAWSIMEPINEDQYLTTFVMHPIDPLLVSAYSERSRGIIRFWNVETGEVLHEITGYGTDEYNAITTLAFSPDGTLLASGGQDGTVRLWGIPAGED